MVATSTTSATLTTSAWSSTSSWVLDHLVAGNKVEVHGFSDIHTWENEWISTDPPTLIHYPVKDSADAAHLAMDQVFTVTSVTSTTQPAVIVLAGEGMTVGTYSDTDKYNVGYVRESVAETPAGTSYDTGTIVADSTAPSWDLPRFRVSPSSKQIQNCGDMSGKTQTTESCLCGYDWAGDPQVTCGSGKYCRAGSGRKQISSEQGRKEPEYLGGTCADVAICDSSSEILGSTVCSCGRGGFVNTGTNIDGRGGLVNNLQCTAIGPAPGELFTTTQATAAMTCTGNQKCTLCDSSPRSPYYQGGSGDLPLASRSTMFRQRNVVSDGFCSSPDFTKECDCDNSCGGILFVSGGTQSWEKISLAKTCVNDCSVCETGPYCGGIPFACGPGPETRL